MHKSVVMIQPVISWNNRSPAEQPEPTSTIGPASRNGSKVGMMSEKVYGSERLTFILPQHSHLYVGAKMTHAACW